MAIEATCDGCGKSWKVPDAGRTYKYKECGGRVQAAPSGPAPAPEPAPPKKKPPPARKEKPAEQKSSDFTTHRVADAIRDPKGAKKRRIIFAAIVVVVLAATMTVVIVMGQPPSVEDRVIVFEETWASGSLTDLEKWFTDDFVRLEWEKHEKTFRYRGWTDERPELSARKISDETEASASVDFQLTGRTFQTRWVKVGDNWRVKAIMLPRHDPGKDPPSKAAKLALSRALARFRTAWNDERFTSITDMVPQENTPSWASRIEYFGNKYKERKLEESPEVKYKTRIRAGVLFSSPKGVVRTSWTSKLDTWQLTGLAFK